MRLGRPVPDFGGADEAAEPALGLVVAPDSLLAHGDLAGGGLGGVEVGVRWAGEPWVGAERGGAWLLVVLDIRRVEEGIKGNGRPGRVWQCLAAWIRGVVEDLAAIR